MTKRAVVSALALATGLVVSPATSAAQQTDTLVLTLQDALRIAEGHNPTYRQAVNSLGMNPVETRATFANQILPSATVDLFNTNYRGNVQRIARDNFGNPIENPEAEWVYFSGTTQALGFDWSIQGSSLFTDLESQQQQNLDRELAEEAALATTHADVRRQYYEVLEQRSLLDMEEEIARAREADLELANQLFRLARSSRVDVLGAELEIEQQSLNVRGQRNAYEQARLALRTSLGDAELPPFRLAREALPIFDPAELDPEGLVSRALEAHPEVRQAESAVATSRIGVKQAKNQWWPNLTVGYDIYRRAQTRKSDALFDVSWDEDLDQQFFVQLSVPFFNDYFGNRREIEQAEVDLDNQREQYRQTRLQTEQDVRSAVLDLANQYETLRLEQRSLEIAEERLELAREEYRVGTRTFENLQQAIQDEADARRRVIAARFGFVDALLDLEVAVGGAVRGSAP